MSKFRDFEFRGDHNVYINREIQEVPVVNFTIRKNFRGKEMQFVYFTIKNNYNVNNHDGSFHS